MHQSKLTVTLPCGCNAIPTRKVVILLVLATVSAVNIAVMLEQTGAPLLERLGRHRESLPFSKDRANHGHWMPDADKTSGVPDFTTSPAPAHSPERYIALQQQESRWQSSHSRVLVTGAAGFIGYHISKALAAKSHTFVMGLDNLSDNNDVSLKTQRRKLLQQCCNITTMKGDIRDLSLLQHLFKEFNFTLVIHMAARAGVLPSVQQPAEYILNNEVGTVALLEAIRQQRVRPALVYASSSSVYGEQGRSMGSCTACVSSHADCEAATYAGPLVQNTSAWSFPKIMNSGSRMITYSKLLAAYLDIAHPQAAAIDNLHPTPECAVHCGGAASVYAATKLATEQLVEVYTRQYGLAATGLRFFTVYGPWGRPDMAPMKLTKQLIEGQYITMTCFKSNKTVQTSNSVSVQRSGRPQQRLNIDATRDTTSGTAERQQLLPTFEHAWQVSHDCVLPYRDFTYVDDIVHGILLAADATVERVRQQHNRHKIYNLGRGQPASLGTLLQTLESLLGKKAVSVQYKLTDSNSPDVFGTWADTTAAERDLGFMARTDLAVGLQKFVDWYLRCVPVPLGT